jgi:hypothetical protein
MMMKRSRYLTIAIIMAIVLNVPLLWIMDTKVAKAATTPTFERTSVDIVGEGKTYQMVIKDKIDKSTYSWSSSNTSIANVSTKGVITAVNKGTATIKCKITYPTKKTKTLTCKVTVTIPATNIRINNSNPVNGAHVLTMGDSYDFNSEVIPDKTSDNVYWSIGGGDPACLRIDDAVEGKVTAVKAGKVILVASAAKSATKEAADLSIVNDAIIIEIVEPVGPTATVKSVNIVDSNHINVEFDSPVVADTVVAANGELSSNIDITLSKDVKKVIADDPGKLTASLSADGKLLTINTEKSLNGFYGISLSDQILTTAGVHLDQFYKKITYTDVTPPGYRNTTVDDTGLIAKINFTEPLNFTNMVINEVKMYSASGQTANSSTLSIMKNAMNYTVSEDKRSLTIDLTNIAYTDRNKQFVVVISGIKDMSGNSPVKMYLEAIVYTDTAYKPQARLISVSRTGYNTITATFDRAIDTYNPGYIQLDGGPSIQGKVDSKDSKKVNYSISDADALFTGVRKVSIGFWSSYNVNPSDTSANRTYDYNVNFTADRTSPQILTYDYNSESGVLTLNCNEDVTITTATGTFSSSFTSANEDIRLINIGYTEMAHTEGKNIIKLKVTNLSLAGNYYFTIPQGFVSDSFRNLSSSRSILISNSSGSSGSSQSELPAPYYIGQNADALNKITIRFMNKLDKASAESIANYKITGLNIINAKLDENTVETGAAVVLTLSDNSVEYNLGYKLIISGVKGFNNSYSAISNYEYPLTLKENKKPAYVPEPVFDKVALNNIKLNFTEDVQGTMSVKVTQTVGSTIYEIPVTSVVVSGNNATINMAGTPNNNGLLWIDIITYDIKDLNGNSIMTMPPRLPLLIKY